MKKVGIFSKLMVLVVSVVVASLLTSSVFVRQYIEKRETEVVQQHLKSVAKIIQESPLALQVVQSHTQSQDMIAYADELVESLKVDFVVVMDTDFIRYSHPTHDIIGQVFSNVEDAGETLTRGAHFSLENGTMGAGLRYFEPLRDASGQVVGIVCVGYRRDTVDLQISQAQMHLFGAFMYGLVIAIGLAYGFAKWLKHTLLGLEPEEISQLLVESTAISQHVTEGIIALDNNHKLLFYNQSAQKIFKGNGIEVDWQLGNKMDGSLEGLLFQDLMAKRQIQQNQRVIIDSLELVVNRSPIYRKGKFVGAVVTFQDQTDFKQLITELSGTEKYNDALRATNHHFMNQMHVLNGLLELKNYEEAEKYISHLKQNYHQNLGYITDIIKLPALAGFLLGKQQEAVNRQVQFSVDQDSFVPDITDDALAHDLTLMLGVLIDNALEAMVNVPYASLNIYLQADVDNNSLVCSVEDNGCGIDAQQEERIFERGYSTKGEHRGYGLEAVMRLVQKRSGQIDVASQLGKGTCMTIEMQIDPQ